MIEKKIFDVAVIGAGPGGYVAAIRAAQLGKTVALIEKEFLGGTCLNVGCIPTKTLLANANVHHLIKRAEEFGITTGPVSIHYEKMKKRKDEVIQKMRGGIEGLIKSNKISLFRGTAHFESRRELKILGADHAFITAEKIIIATGSIPMDIAAFPCDHKKILNSTSILELTHVPTSLVIVGGGYIGCEFASLFAELGAKVTILEALPTILMAQGQTIAQFMTKAMMKRGIEIRTGAKVKAIQHHQEGVRVSLEGEEWIDAEKALIAVGRLPYTKELRLEKAGLSVTQRGFLDTNERMETEVADIYAIGDVTGKGMLAHVASHQAMVAAENACSYPSSIHYEAVPAVVFTSPEIATVGITPEKAQELGYNVTVGAFPFQALGKAQASLEQEGFTQVISDAKTGQILGAAVVGHDASNLIAEMTLAMQNELTLESILETIHAHPTMAESWHEAVAMALQRPIHLPPKVKR